MTGRGHEDLGSLAPEALVRHFLDRAPVSEEEQMSVDVVHKFGGTSMAQMGKVTDIIDSARRNGGSHIVVVSAMAGITDRLLDTWNEIVALPPEESAALVEEVVLEPHIDKAKELALTEAEYARLSDDFAAPSLALFEQFQRGHYASRDVTISAGERFSSLLLAASLRSQGVNAEAVDAAQFLITGPSLESGTQVMWEETRNRGQRLLRRMLREGVIPVVTGFTGRRVDGEITTLGRGGSDYTATVIGRIMNAKTVNIWTDVEGVYTGNPKTDKTATFIPRMTHAKGDEMAKAGHKVLYTRTLEPLIGTPTVAVVRSTFNPQHPGTRIVPG